MIFRRLKKRLFNEGREYVNCGALLLESRSRLVYRNLPKSEEDIEKKLDETNIEEFRTVCERIKKLEQKYGIERPKILKDAIENFENVHRELCEIAAYSKTQAGVKEG